MNILPTDHNLDFAAVLLEEMEAYLLSSEVFWPLEQTPKRGKSRFPRLTLGVLQLTLDQLEAMHSEMTPAQDANHHRLMMKIDLLRAKHTVALETKAEREAISRLNLWRAFVADLEESPGRAGNYAYEIRHRVMLSRLTELVRESSDLRTAIENAQAVDQRLRRLFKQDSFVWDQRLQQIYSRDQFWFLYGHPREEG